MPIPIMGAPSASYAVVRNNALSNSPSQWYLRALVALWDAGLETGVDPVVLAAQCALETGWGRFGGAMRETHGNTCGLKTRNATGDTAADLAKFMIDSNGYPCVGARAHAHHLRLYSGFPVPADTPDERACFVQPGTAGFGSALNVADLGGKWAPARDYGKKIEIIIQRLRG
jgi:N-acetylmuramoyl-L-alanine amidase